MTALFIFGVLISSVLPAQAQHNLTEVNFELDKEFHHMDRNKNNAVDVQEFEAILNVWDRDNDGCVGMTEFFAAHSSDSLTMEWALFSHFDHNQDSCLEIPDLVDEFHIVDINPQNGEITLQEYEVYYDKVLANIGFLNLQSS
ncbi:uncharacterized protein LOC123559025 [Mercenaria mercenaria]|uniref:uncharacterized protein LOC123559025 n=1 Tax=Mercenaria mercenaria TaxID=6596 RepID=UPI00234EDCE6|nr:uncharacterized protein LOC123559025 [Mercenaria mercenaria]